MPFHPRRLLSFLYEPGRWYDANAWAYFRVAGIRDVVEMQAVNKFIVELKRRGLWLRMDRVWLCSPTSLRAALICCKSLTTMTAYNDPTFSTTGIQFDGATNFLDCNFNCSTQSDFMTSSNAHMSIYQRANIALGVAETFFGSFQSAVPSRYAVIGKKNTDDFSCRMFSTTNFVGSVQTDFVGFYTQSRRSSTDREIYKNTTSMGTQTTSTTIAPSGARMCIGAQGTITLGTVSTYSNIEFAGATLGDGLTTAEVEYLYNAFQNYQTALGREV